MKHKLEVGRSYCVRLCSGELRTWIYQGSDRSGQAWWQDAESGLGFAESSILYAWELCADEPVSPTQVSPTQSAG